MEISTWAPGTLHQLSTHCPHDLSSHAGHTPLWIPLVDLSHDQYTNFPENVSPWSSRRSVKRSKVVCVAAARRCARLPHNPGPLHTTQMLGTSSQPRSARVVVRQIYSHMHDIYKPWQWLWYQFQMNCFLSFLKQDGPNQHWLADCLVWLAVSSMVYTLVQRYFGKYWFRTFSLAFGQKWLYSDEREGLMRSWLGGGGLTTPTTS